jgi:cell division protein FtsB
MSRGTATARRPIAPRTARRVSGPARPVVLPPVVAPQRTTGAMRAVDHRWLDSLLRSRAWIWLIGIGLGGIVAMQVSLLKLNTGISRAVESAATLERQNAELEVQVARLSSDDKIRAAAERIGLVMPDASEVQWLNARGSRDVSRAVTRMQPPSSDSAKLMAAGGHAAPGTVFASTTITPVPAATPVPQAPPTATATPAPVATAAPTPAPTASPTPAPTAAATGGQSAPGQG